LDVLRKLVAVKVAVRHAETAGKQAIAGMLESVTGCKGHQQEKPQKQKRQ
jgi:hypothetical protein